MEVLGFQMAFIGFFVGDLPPNFHPAAFGVSFFFTPFGAGVAICDRRSRARKPNRFFS
jgi:hypothetical protein